MSFWYSTEKQREVYLMKQRYMNNILQYNKHQIQDKSRRKQHQSKSFTEHSHQMNEEAINQLILESTRNLRRREEEKNMLKESYQKQMRQKAERKKYQKETDLIYASRQRERMDFEQNRRVFQLSKMFNRPTYQGTPTSNHRRTKTEAQDNQPLSNPERYQRTPLQTSSKNLNEIEINLLPPQHSSNNLAPKNQQGDSLDRFNYSFHKKEDIKKY